MNHIVETVDQFTARWRTPPNFRVAPELLPFERSFPEARQVLEAIRQDAETRVTILGADDPAIRTARSLAFRTASLDEVITWPFRLAHFNLTRLYDGLLGDLQAEVMIPWRTFLSSMGFTWLRCAPVLFISTAGASSTYHADNSHGLVWQIEGTKTFHSYLDPDRAAPAESAINGEITAEHPPPHDSADRQSLIMQPGDLLWSHVLTPHWVSAESSLTMSLTLSHGGLCYRGSCSARDMALRSHWDVNPGELWLTDLRNTRY